MRPPPQGQSSGSGASEELAHLSLRRSGSPIDPIPVIRFQELTERVPAFQPAKTILNARLLKPVRTRTFV